MSKITIGNNECLMCEGDFNKLGGKTTHHVIPKHMEPKNNVLISLCIKCHNKLHQSPAMNGKQISYDKFIKKVIAENRANENKLRKIFGLSEDSA